MGNCQEIAIQENRVSPGKPSSKVLNFEDCRRKRLIFEEDIALSSIPEIIKFQAQQTVVKHPVFKGISLYQQSKTYQGDKRSFSDICIINGKYFKKHVEPNILEEVHQTLRAEKDIIATGNDVFQRHVQIILRIFVQ
ncbi:hypothetical protein HPP92_028856 [Vanilla planifolia]|uniref:Uncharacterized protein n=1 Tax=Vanilla planifolia TaxID=51239 RepID=A0A835P3V2_VANPL|nr:hypothetical protein HPP92_028856 [Vanilla planifolia]KAG0446405.1 hypothetical protein HPP92_028845 [Vanilla planifolia]